MGRVSGNIPKRLLTTIGDIIYASAVSIPARLAAVATNQRLTSQGVGAAPAWAQTISATTIEGTDATDSTSSVTGAMKTAGGLGVAKNIFGTFIDLVKSSSPYSRVSQSATGPFLTRLIGSKYNITDNTITSFLTVTVPNGWIGGTIHLDVMVVSNNASRWRYSGQFIYIGRAANGATSVAITPYIPEVTLLTGAAETLTVTFEISAISGANNATQTFTVRVTIDTDANVVGYLHYVAELFSNQYGGGTEITMAAA